MKTNMRRKRRYIDYLQKFSFNEDLKVKQLKCKNNIIDTCLERTINK